MGSGTSRLENRWWEAEAQRTLLATGDTWKVEVICSLIPVVDEATLVSSLKARPDLEILFDLHCGYQNLSGDQNADSSPLTVDFKVNELLRVLRMPPGCGEIPWDRDWHLPLEGSASEIAAKIHAAVCQAVFRIPFSDLVKYALGYSTRATSLNSLLDAVCDVRDTFRKKYRSHPGTQGIYIEVEAVSELETAKVKY
ncbi:hypothetical protein DL98DRAFT_124038 [Cadophora sp. DSE1049]|nr:hypothetical protein DL98DRAFT_124038 [Cadophora sp. DSE1049]